MSRYTRRPIAVNSNEMYEDHFEVRDVNSIEQFRTPKIIYPKSDDAFRIGYFSHPWSVTDKYYKLAAKYYGDSKLWWVIAQFNKAPTEQHLTEGQIVKVPHPLAAALTFLRQE